MTQCKRILYRCVSSSLYAPTLSWGRPGYSTPPSLSYCASRSLSLNRVHPRSKRQAENGSSSMTGRLVCAPPFHVIFSISMLLVLTLRAPLASSSIGDCSPPTPIPRSCKRLVEHSRGEAQHFPEGTHARSDGDCVRVSRKVIRHLVCTRAKVRESSLTHRHSIVVADLSPFNHVLFENVAFLRTVRGL